MMLVPIKNNHQKVFVPIESSEWSIRNLSWHNNKTDNYTHTKFELCKNILLKTETDRQSWYYRWFQEWVAKMFVEL